MTNDKKAKNAEALCGELLHLLRKEVGFVLSRIRLGNLKNLNLTSLQVAIRRVREFMQGAISHEYVSAKSRFGLAISQCWGIINNLLTRARAGRELVYDFFGSVASALDYLETHLMQVISAQEASKPVLEVPWHLLKNEGKPTPPKQHLCARSSSSHRRNFRRQTRLITGRRRAASNLRQQGRMPEPMSGVSYMRSN